MKQLFGYIKAIPFRTAPRTVSGYHTQLCHMHDSQWSEFPSLQVLQQHGAIYNVGEPIAVTTLYQHLLFHDHALPALASVEVELSRIPIAWSFDQSCKTAPRPSVGQDSVDYVRHVANGTKCDNIVSQVTAAWFFQLARNATGVQHLDVKLSYGNEHSEHTYLNTEAINRCGIIRSFGYWCRMDVYRLLVPMLDDRVFDWAEVIV